MQWKSSENTSYTEKNEESIVSAQFFNEPYGVLRNFRSKHLDVNFFINQNQLNPSVLRARLLFDENGAHFE